MSNVYELRPLQLEKLANDFVEIYTSEGDTSAAYFIIGKYEPHESDRLQNLIKINFLSRGWTYPETTDAELAAAAKLKAKRETNETS